MYRNNRMEKMAEIEKVIFMNMCMVYDHAGRVLALDKVGKSYSGTTFPGGHVEPGETFTESVIREIYEETGLTVENPVLCGVKQFQDGRRYVVLLYRASRFTGVLRSSDEGRVFWLELDDMRKANLAEGMEKTLDVFLNERLSECYFHQENGEWIETIK